MSLQIVFFAQNDSGVGRTFLILHTKEGKGVGPPVGPQWVQGKAPVGVQGAKSPEAHEF